MMLDRKGEGPCARPCARPCSCRNILNAELALGKSTLEGYQQFYRHGTCELDAWNASRST
jgi:hypothetical protein